MAVRRHPFADAIFFEQDRPHKRAFDPIAEYTRWLSEFSNQKDDSDADTVGSPETIEQKEE